MATPKSCRANGADAITIGGPYLDLYYSTGDMHD